MVSLYILSSALNFMKIPYLSLFIYMCVYILLYTHIHTHILINTHIYTYIFYLYNFVWHMYLIHNLYILHMLIKIINVVISYIVIFYKLFSFPFPFCLFFNPCSSYKLLLHIQVSLITKAIFISISSYILI